MSGHDFKVPSPYSEVQIPGTLYIPQARGRLPVCYICPDMASARAGPYGILGDISERLAAAGTIAVTFDTAGNGERSDETATFLDQDVYDLDRIRSYIRAGLGERIGSEILAGYGAGALTAATYATRKDFERLILITPMLTWKNELDMMRRGKADNRDCPAGWGYAKCRKDRAYVEELEYRTAQCSDGMNAVMHQLASFTGEIRALCGTRDGSGTAAMLRTFTPYYERRDGIIEMEDVPGIGRRTGLDVPELKLRLAELAADAMTQPEWGLETAEKLEEYAR